MLVISWNKYARCEFNIFTDNHIFLMSELDIQLHLYTVSITATQSHIAHIWASLESTCIISARSFSVSSVRHCRSAVSSWFRRLRLFNSSPVHQQKLPMFITTCKQVKNLNWKLHTIDDLTSANSTLHQADVSYIHWSCYWTQKNRDITATYQ